MDGITVTATLSKETKRNHRFDIKTDAVVGSLYLSKESLEDGEAVPETLAVRLAEPKTASKSA